MSAIELRGVVKRYPPREPGLPPQELLRGVDLTVRRGEFVAVEGQSGSGKSTLLHVLGGLDRTFEGEARVLGCDLRALSDAELSALRHTQIGFVFQSFNLLPALTALENVLLPDYFGDGVPDAGRRAAEALDRVGLTGKEGARPATLSGGERQRVAIARALVVEPSLILADEPTGNLDSQTGREIMDALERAGGDQRTIILVTHEEEIAARARRILRLRDGQVVSDQAVRPS